MTPPQPDRCGFVDDELRRRQEQSRMRLLRDVQPLAGGKIDVDGRILENFSSNDYLGLAFHPELKRRAVEAIESDGAGSTASRLISGSNPRFSALETKLAALKKVESALIFNSGYQANATLLPALCDRHSFVLLDRACHSSLVQGALGSRATVKRFGHGDMDQLRDQLCDIRGRSSGRVFVATESLFSMDGDTSDLGALLSLRAEFETFLIVDDAHGFGVLGPGGGGLACDPKIDLVIGTFGKACGAFGAFVSCSQNLRSYLINCCGGFVYSTALPPAVLGAIDAALDLLPTMGRERRRLRENAHGLRMALRSRGWECGQASAQIVPVVVGGEAEAMQLAQYLEENGIFAVPIRPPTVSSGASRIRLTVTSEHDGEQVDQLVTVLESWRERRD